MAPRLKLNPIATAHMARAYHAGMKPAELARDYGVSPAYVIMAANRWDRRRRMRLPKRDVPALVPVEQPVENHSAKPEIYQSSSGLMAYYETEAREFLQSVRGGMRHIETRVSLPAVSMLFPQAFRQGRTLRKAR